MSACECFPKATQKESSKQRLPLGHAAVIGGSRWLWHMRERKARENSGMEE